MISVARKVRSVDSLEVCVLVDNALDMFSTVPECVTSPMTTLLNAGAKELSGSCLCCAAWGLSLVLTTRIGTERRTLLFDAGPGLDAFEYNGARLGIDFAAIECVALSHGHYDHAGGLSKALQLITNANGGNKVPMRINPWMFAPRGLTLSNGTILPLGHVPTPEELDTVGGAVINSDEPRVLLGDTVFLSGEIPRVTTYEQGLPEQCKRRDDGPWVPDPLVLDERILAVHVKNAGIVVFSSCSHAGIVNVLKNATELFAPVPLHTAMGGLHLSGPANERWIGETVRDLSTLGLSRLIPGHCTGWRALHALVRAFGDIVIPGVVGQVHRFGTNL